MTTHEKHILRLERELEIVCTKLQTAALSSVERQELANNGTKLARQIDSLRAA